MGNRILKEGICESEQINGLSWAEEVFFYRLLVVCDDYGIMDARPKMLKSKMFPLRDEVTPQTCEASVEALIRAGLIRVYVVAGQPYLQVIKWGEHQRLRDSKHRYPMPEEAAAAGGEARESAADCGELPHGVESENHPPHDPAASCGELPQVAANGGELRQTAANGGSRVRPRAGAESESEYEYESESEYESHARAGARGTAPGFDEFWAAYPNKTAKKAAAKAWAKLKPDAALMAKIMDGLAKWKNSDEWAEDGGRYIPHPATWLNGERWEDEVRPRRAGNGRGTVLAQNYDQRSYEGVQEAIMARQEAEMEAFLREN